MDIQIKEIIVWSLKRWYWFAISVILCCILGGVYFLCKAPVYKVNASLMLRQNDRNGNAQDEMMRMMGFGGDKITGDEVEVLTSRRLMQQVVDSLDLTSTYTLRTKRFSVIQYPQHDITVTLAEPFRARVVVDVRLSDGVARVRVKSGWTHRSKAVLTLPCDTMSTFAGLLTLTLNNPEAEGHYRVTILPRANAVERNIQQLSVSRLSKESNIICLATSSTCPQRSEDIINTLLDLYNVEAAADKMRLALQTDRFLRERIAVVASQLDEAEVQLEEYKREHRIANITAAAESYRSTEDQYQRKAAELDAQESVLNFIAAQLNRPENAYSVVPGNLGLENLPLQNLIDDYNHLIVMRAQLLVTAAETNPAVVQLGEQIDATRSGVMKGITEAREAIRLRREHEQAQQQQYNTRLGAVPAQERRFLELQRDRTAKEKQYLYLIAKQEENTLLLASDVVPAKVVDYAGHDPAPVAPKLKTTVIFSFLIGLCLPLLLFFGLKIKED